MSRQKYSSASWATLPRSDGDMPMSGGIILAGAQAILRESPEGTRGLIRQHAHASALNGAGS